MSKWLKSSEFGHGFLAKMTNRSARETLAYANRPRSVGILGRFQE